MMFFIDIDNNYSLWRQHARELLKRNIRPEQISWQSDSQTSLFSNTDTRAYLERPIIKQQLTITRDFFKLADYIVHYRDPSRWALLYRIAWRLVYEDAKLLRVQIDDDIYKAMHMRKVIGRDKHKMEAFVRFRKVTNQNFFDSNKRTQENNYYVAWFEPEHPILPVVEPFFKKRFYNMQWSILTPDACMHWDGNAIQYTEGLAKAPATEDVLELLWLEYYKNIFNPARLKLKAMQSEMPKKYWVNLPEAPLIAELTQAAQYRTEHMIDKGAGKLSEKMQKSRFVQQAQHQLRSKRST